MHVEHAKPVGRCGAGAIEDFLWSKLKDDEPTECTSASASGASPPGDVDAQPLSPVAPGISTAPQSGVEAKPRNAEP